jgi:tetratricopeptide (TPR) repeat protein
MFGIRKTTLLLALMLLSGCATGGGGGPLSRLASLMNSYDAAEKDYNQGRIMEARARILSMDKTREDYPQAQKLLRTKVEPARLRLLRHYESKAEKAERGGVWYQAQSLYAQAAEFSTKPEALQKKSKAMEMRMRQERMELLLKQRRKEDAELMSWPDAYEASKGVAPDDEAIICMRDNYQDALDDRIQLAYWEAKRYFRKGLPELAYVQIESHLRLSPDSVSGKRLLEDIKAAMPREFRIPPEGKIIRKSVVRRTQRPATSEAVTAAKVEGLINAGKWKQARQYALAYRREGGKNAERLLKQIDAGIEKQAEAFYEQGSFAFRREQIDKAVEYWEKAVDLMPEKGEYVDALRRAQQMQERLRLLRGGENSDSGK